MDYFCDGFFINDICNNKYNTFSSRIIAQQQGHYLLKDSKDVVVVVVVVGKSLGLKFAVGFGRCGECSMIWLTYFNAI